MVGRERFLERRTLSRVYFVELNEVVVDEKVVEAYDKCEQVVGVIEFGKFVERLKYKIIPCVL
jgi:hypothetical protein